MEDARYTTTEHRHFINGRNLAGGFLLLAIVWISGCAPFQPAVVRTIELSPTIVPTRISPAATSHPTLLSTDAIFPTWSEVELPPGCFFHSLSPDLRWVVMMGCRHDLGDTNWIVQVDENGRLYNFRQLKGRLLPYDEGIGIIGFTTDSSRLIVKQDRTFEFINLADLTREPYELDTRGTSGIKHFGTERWSLNGRLYLSPDCWGCGQIFVIYPDGGTEEMVLDGIGRHGAQYTWSTDGEEIAYVEGDYHESMRARVFNRLYRK